MVQAHGPKQAVGPGQAGIGMHQEGGALHEGPQVNVHVALLIRQVPVQSSTVEIITDLWSLACTREGALCKRGVKSIHIWCSSSVRSLYKTACQLSLLHDHWHVSCFDSA